MPHTPYIVQTDIGELEAPPIVHYDENILIIFQEFRVENIVLFRNASFDYSRYGQTQFVACTIHVGFAGVIRGVR